MLASRLIEHIIIITTLVARTKSKEGRDQRTEPVIICATDRKRTITTTFSKVKR